MRPRVSRIERDGSSEQGFARLAVLVTERKNIAEMIRVYALDDELTFKGAVSQFRSVSPSYLVTSNGLHIPAT